MQAWIPDINVNFSLNGPAWYLSLAFFLYLCFPYIIKIVKKISNSGIRKLWCWIGLIYILQAVLSLIIYTMNLDEQIKIWFTYMFPMFRIGDFIIGCLCAEVIKKTKDSENVIFDSVLEAISIILLIITIIIRIKIGDDCLTRTILYSPCVVFLIVSFARENGIITKYFSRINFINIISKVSDIGFIIHYPILLFISIIVKHFFGNSKYIIFIFTFAITIAIAYIYKYLLKRILRKP